MRWSGCFVVVLFCCVVLSCFVLFYFVVWSYLGIIDITEVVVLSGSLTKLVTHLIILAAQQKSFLLDSHVFTLTIRGLLKNILEFPSQLHHLPLKFPDHFLVFTTITSSPWGGAAAKEDVEGVGLAVAGVEVRGRC